jgi:GNAT superfamily N-acetyltransferase
MTYRIRQAERADQPRLEQLIADSARALGTRAYRSEQIEAALRGAFGVDSQLIEDGTYFVAELDGVIIGCGGWSRRGTLFGGDRHAQRDARELNPQIDAARIRAFFVAPGHARQGVGRALLVRCEAAARAQGFTRFELMGTLTGVAFYEALGYEAGEIVRYPATPDVVIEFVPMRKVTGP